MGALIFTVLWSLISTILLINSYDRSSLQSQRVRSLLATIFNYQTRYDKVYEKTYPNDGSLPRPLPQLSDYDKKQALADSDSNSSDSSDQDVSDNDASMALAAKTTMQDDDNDIGDEEIDELDTEESAMEVSDSSDDTATDGNDKPPVKLDKYRLTQRGQKLSLEFAIKNLVRPQKANGYVIGFAKFIGIDGTTTTVSSPGNIKEGQKINKWKLPRSNRFSIRYYTKKNLVFDLPDKRGGTFESIKIIVGGKNNEPLEFMYNIKGSEGAFAPALGTIPNNSNDSSSGNSETPSQGT